MPDRKLKFFVPIFTDPVGWSRWIGNSLFFVFIWFLIHFLFVFLGLNSIYEELVLSGIGDQKAFDIIEQGFRALAFIGILLPTMYAYTIFRLLKIIDKTNES